MTVSKQTQRILSDIDTAFGEIKKGNEVHSSLRTIKYAIAKLGVNVLTITIVPADKDDFFGMSIYPTYSVTDKIVDCMIDRKPLKAYEEIWSNCDSWIIEIDSKLINGELNANPQEMTAALLHELGHTVYSNSIPVKLHKTMGFLFLNLPREVKMILENRNSSFKTLFAPMVAQASSSVTYSMKKELESDKFVISMGYGKSLESLLNKILITYGSRFADTTVMDNEMDLRVAGSWAKSHAIELRVRKDHIRKSIADVCNITPSKYVIGLFNNINDNIFNGTKSIGQMLSSENRKNYVSESTDYIDDTRGIPCNYVIESAKNSKFDKYGKLQKITQHDLDIVAIQIDKIDNQNDKIYLLDVIYDYMSTIDLADECIANGQKGAVAMNERQLATTRKNLEDLRKQVLAVKITDKNYGVFIKYPVGYEG